ncbi:MAG: 3-deoxy-manno-octulosonate cytidylyltransferase [Deltaproteobacteria bacterium]|nr:3-deoxy-manno-octulosonate cytidylyltransferase [Deltaproteobacteria bacterium]MBI4223736.1 3-deoxy-manno-octulosonate cytidylyltransferase [Deltaproteobacteria bacterium]
MTTKIAAVIPARMASQRLPGKPLLEIEGLPMIEHVRRRVLLAKGFSRVVVATCDPIIAETVEDYGGEVLMTSPAHQVATERIIEAIQHLDCTHVINVQGDEVLVLPSDLEKMTSAIQAHPEKPVWNAVAPLESEETLKDQSIVKCRLSPSGRILSFVREGSSETGPLYWVIGLLAYRRGILEEFARWKRSALEAKASIEQMRFLENDVPIASVLFAKAYPGINEEREVGPVKDYLHEDRLQRSVLRKVLAS